MTHMVAMIKALINLTNQFTNLEMIVIRNVRACSLVDGYLSVIFMSIAVRPYSMKVSFNDFFKYIVNETVTS
jgi:hypothetical protein